MANTRLTKENNFLRYEFTQEERLKMGDDLAQAHNRVEEIDEEEASMKAQIKQSRSGIEATIGMLSRNLANGFVMRTIECVLRYDDPNVGEVSVYRTDDGTLVKTRPMTENERQLDLPLDTAEQVQQSADASEKAAGEFFSKHAGTTPKK
jgi:hypothetical protein